MLIEACASTENDVMMSEYNAKNGAALARLINDHGVKLEKFSDKVYDGFGKAAEEVFEETRASSGLAERIHTSFLKARKEIGAWTNLSDSPYIQQRNRVLGM